MALHPASILRRQPTPRLDARRLKLRPLAHQDFKSWREVRVRNEAWLLPWEPQRESSLPDPTRERNAFEARCSARDRERSADHAYPFGIFVDNQFAGEVNVNDVTRGALQSATIGYWIDQSLAGNSYTSEAVAVVLQFAFEQLQLHRIEICIVPRNTNSRRVVEKLGIRCEGVAERYLEIAGTWEDHMRFAITAEEWNDRRAEMMANWIVA